MKELKKNLVQNKLNKNTEDSSWDDSLPQKHRKNHDSISVHAVDNYIMNLIEQDRRFYDLHILNSLLAHVKVKNINKL